jgi:hypothetical protein
MPALYTQSFYFVASKLSQFFMEGRLNILPALFVDNFAMLRSRARKDPDNNETALKDLNVASVVG